MPPQVFNILEVYMICKGFVTLVNGHSNKKLRRKFDDQVAFLSHQCRMGLTLADVEEKKGTDK